MIVAPTTDSAGLLPNPASHQFFAQRGIYGQLAIFRDWIVASSNMSSRIDTIISQAFKEKLTLQKALFFVLGVFIGAGVGYVMGHMMLG